MNSYGYIHVLGSGAFQKTKVSDTDSLSMESVLKIQKFQIKFCVNSFYSKTEIESHNLSLLKDLLVKSCLHNLTLTPPTNRSRLHDNCTSSYP